MLARERRLSRRASMKTTSGPPGPEKEETAGAPQLQFGLAAVQASVSSAGGSGD